MVLWKKKKKSKIKIPKFSLLKHLFSSLFRSFVVYRCVALICFHFHKGEIWFRFFLLLLSWARRVQTLIGVWCVPTSPCVHSQAVAEMGRIPEKLLSKCCLLRGVRTTGATHLTSFLVFFFVICHRKAIKCPRFFFFTSKTIHLCLARLPPQWHENRHDYW